MPKPKRDRTRALIGLTLLAMPAALVTEQLLARVFLPPELEIVREHFSDVLVPVGWVLIGTTLATGSFAVVAHRRSVRRAVDHLGPDPHGNTVQRKRLSSFLLYASLPQVPAVLTTVGCLVGIQLTHAVITVLLSTMSILAMGATTARSVGALEA